MEITLPATAGVFSTGDVLQVVTAADYTGTLTFAPASGVTEDGTFTVTEARRAVSYVVAGVDEYLAIGTSGGASAWGDLTGTLSDQTDMQAALDAKAPLAVGLTAETGSFSVASCDIGKVIKVTGAGPYTATFPAGLLNGGSVLLWNATSDSLTVAGAAAAYKIGPGSAAAYVESPDATDDWERLPGGGTSGGTAYDQDLNTTDNVTFNSVTASNAVTANDVQVNDLLEVVGSSSFDTVAEFNDGLALTAEGATIAGGLTVSEGNVTTTGQYLTANGQALALVDSLASADVLTDLGYAQATKIIGVDRWLSTSASAASSASPGTASARRTSRPRPSARSTPRRAGPTWPSRSRRTRRWPSSASRDRRAAA